MRFQSETPFSKFSSVRTGPYQFCLYNEAMVLLFRSIDEVTSSEPLSLIAKYLAKRNELRSDIIVPAPFSKSFVTFHYLVIKAVLIIQLQ